MMEVISTLPAPDVLRCGTGCDNLRVMAQWRRIAQFTLATVGAVALIVTLVRTVPSQSWWPGWAAVAAWWPAIVVVIAVVGVTTIRRWPTTHPSPPAQSPQWARRPNGTGWARTATSKADAESHSRSGGIDWSKVNSAVAAFTALAALLFTALSLNATRDQINVAEQGQITDRYTAAVNQISTPGADHLETRLGGIYALERLAIDSPRDQPTIIQVLSAFVRSNAPLPAGPKGQACTPVALDVQAALTVLGRRNPAHDAEALIDLSQSCLTDANFTHANLTGANLTGTNLTNADLTDAGPINTDFAGANLTGANLTGAHLADSSLTNANLTNANLTNAELTDAISVDAFLNGAHLAEAQLYQIDLTGASLVDADLTDADLVGANLTNAELSGARLGRAQLGGAQLTKASLTSAFLSGAQLTSANLVGASLNEADLNNSNLHHAFLNSAVITNTDLAGANLTNADLTDANFTNSNLTGADLTGAKRIDTNFSNVTGLADH